MASWNCVSTSFRLSPVHPSALDFLSPLLFTLSNSPQKWSSHSQGTSDAQLFFFFFYHWRLGFFFGWSDMMCLLRVVSGLVLMTFLNESQKPLFAPHAHKPAMGAFKCWRGHRFSSVLLGGAQRSRHFLSRWMTKKKKGYFNYETNACIRAK